MKNIDKILRCLFVAAVCVLLAAASQVEKGDFVGKGFSNSQNDIESSAGQAVMEIRQQQKIRILRKNILRSAAQQSIQEILANAKTEMTGIYEIEDSFLQWLSGKYGSQSLYALRQAAEKRIQSMESWHEITGNSLHVLWVQYCRFSKNMDYEPEKVYDKVCARDDRIILDFTGDINLSEGQSITNYLDRQPRGVKDCFSDALWQEMQSADILMVNNEFTFSKRGKPLPGKAYTFRANPERVHVLTEMGTDIASLANNHVYDYGVEALLDTMDTMDMANLPYVGAGRNLQEAVKPVYFVANGRKIAIVAATQIERTLNYTKEASEETAGVLKTLNPDKFVSVVREAESRSDYVIAFVHWGTENSRNYEKSQVDLAHAFIDAGADAVIGGHTHCLQGFDYYKGKPVIYSLGNFWFNGRTIDTGLSQVVINTDNNKIEFRFLPCIQRDCCTALVEETEERQRILNNMQRISAHGVSVGSDGLVTEFVP